MTIEKELSKVDGAQTTVEVALIRSFVLFPIQLPVYKYRGRNMMRQCGSVHRRIFECEISQLRLLMKNGGDLIIVIGLGEEWEYLKGTQKPTENRQRSSPAHRLTGPKSTDLRF